MDISVVIPVFNEEKNIQPLYNGLKAALRNVAKNYEILFVDDGSADNTAGNVKHICNIDKKVKLVQFQKNFSKSAALSAGFDYSKGNIIIRKR